MVKVVNSYSNRKYGSFDSLSEARSYIRRKKLEEMDESRGARGHIIYVYDTKTSGAY
jgi:hypothetical protein